MALKTLKRLRHSHGFGVHSPYAFRFVKSVISPARGYAYYAEEDFEGLLAKEPHRFLMEKEARALLRIAAFTNPRSAYLPAGVHVAFRFALRAVNSRIQLTESLSKLPDVELAATFTGSQPIETLCEYIAQPGRTLLIRDISTEDTDRIFEAMKEGIMFEGKSNCIFISRPQTRKVRYLMNL